MDPNDPLFLVSRGLDGDLGGDEQLLLEGLLADSESLRAEAEKLRSVSKLMNALGGSEAEVDWKTHEQLVMAQIGAKQTDFSGVDELLEVMSRRRPVYDERALIAGIMGRIAPAKKQRAWNWRSIARVGAPLAAAAAVALAVTANWFAPVVNMSMSPVTVVQIGPSYSGEATESSVVVMFSRQTRTVQAMERTESIGYMTLGSTPLIAATEESPL